MEKGEPPREIEDTNKPPGGDNGISPATKVYVCLLILASLSIIIGYIVPNWPEPKCSGCKGYCSMAEQDAKNVMASLASYFSDPENMRIPSINTLRLTADLSLNNDYPEPTIWPPEGINAYLYNTIKVKVYDNTGCCPRGRAYIATGNAYLTPESAAREQVGIKRLSPVLFQGGYWEK